MFIAAVLLSGCATTVATPLGKQQLGALTVQQAIGLTQSELRARLGLPPLDQIRVNALTFEHHVVNYTVNGETFIWRVDCPERQGQTRSRMVIESAGLFVFRDGRLVSVLRGGTEGSWTDGSPAPPDAVISVSCWYGHRSDGSNVVGDLIMVAPWTPLLIIAAPFALAPDDEARVLATIRVGEELPGGFDEFTRSNRGTIQIDRNDGSESELRLAAPGAPRSTARVRIYVRDGIVERIAAGPGETCILREDQRSMDCRYH